MLAAPATAEEMELLAHMPEAADSRLQHALRSIDGGRWDDHGAATQDSVASLVGCCRDRSAPRWLPCWQVRKRGPLLPRAAWPPDAGLHGPATLQLEDVDAFQELAGAPLVRQDILTTRSDLSCHAMGSCLMRRVCGSEYASRSVYARYRCGCRQGSRSFRLGLCL